MYRQYRWNLNGDSEVLAVTPPSYYGTPAGFTEQGSLYDLGTLKRRDGTVWTFSNGDATPLQLQQRGIVAVVSSITYPNGETLTYNYQSGYLRSVVSNTGYMLHLEGYSPILSYSPTKVTLINLKTDYCAPLATTCSGLTVNWPSVSWATSGSVYSATDNAARVRTRTTTGQGSGYVQWLHTSPEGRWFEYKLNITGPYNMPGSSQQCDPRSFLAWLKTADGQWDYTWTGGTNCQFLGVTGGVSTGPDGVTQKWDGGFVDGLNRKTVYGIRTYNVYQFGGGDLDGVASVAKPETDRVDYTYDIRHNLTSAVVTNKAGTATISATASYQGSCTTSNFKTCHKPDYTIDPRGGRTDYTYSNVHGGVLTKMLPADANGVRATQTNTYEQRYANYQIGAGVFANGTAVWKLITTSTCNTQATCTGTDDEVITTYSYDANLIPTTVTTRTGTNTVLSVVTTTYDPVGNLTSVDGPMSGADDTVYYFYNDARERTGEISPDPDGAGTGQPRRVTKTTYNLDGQPTKIEVGTATGTTMSTMGSPSLVTDIGYDAMGRKAKQTVTGGSQQSVTQYSYDVRGRLVCTAVRMNPAEFANLPGACALSAPAGTTTDPIYDRITKTVYDAAGQAIQVRRAVGVPLLEQAYSTASYTLNGKVEDTIDARGARTRLAYDGFDRLASMTMPSPTTPSAYNATTQSTALATAGLVNSADYETYGYDANGNRTSWRKRDGQTFGFAYDALNRQTMRDLPGTTTEDVYAAYDLAGRVTQQSFGGLNGLNRLVNDYDPLGRVKKAWTYRSGSAVTAINYEYDAAGRRTRMHWANMDVVYDYDTLGQLKKIRENGVTAGPGVLATYTYDDLGRRTLLTRGNGASTSYGYDALARLDTLSQTFPAATASNVSQTLTYNPANQILTRGMSNNAYLWSFITGTQNATYDGLNRDAAITSLGNGLCAGTGGYDCNGNLRNDGTRALTYDVENRLRTMTAPGQALTVDYDAAGRLNRTSSNGTVTYLAYDGQNLVEEQDGSNNRLRYYIHGPGTDEPLAWYEGDGVAVRRWFHQDNQGSVIAWSKADGTIGATYSYGPWGEPSSWSGVRFAYTGQTVLPGASLYHYKARVYDPEFGRFLQTDPIGTKDDLNLYAYVGGDPVNRTDPTGLWTCDTVNNKAGCDRFREDLKTLAEAANSKKISASDRRHLTAVVSSYGKEGAGGPRILFGALKAGHPAQTSGTSSVTFDYNQIDAIFAQNNLGTRARKIEGAAIVAHEGHHIYDNGFRSTDWAKYFSGGYPRQTYYTTIEIHGFRSQYATYRAFEYTSKIGPNSDAEVRYQGYQHGWSECVRDPNCL